ncbi:MAG: hypothetical protein RLO17_17880 [Cyclobacteriaceae bacterium]
MIHLIISDKDPQQVELKERLDSLSLARKIDIDTTTKQPVLAHDKKNYTGIDDITQYLDEMEAYMKQWYACRCDMYPE